jgi:hypothetical protein
MGYLFNREVNKLPLRLTLLQFGSRFCQKVDHLPSLLYNSVKNSTKQ